MIGKAAMKIHQVISVFISVYITLIKILISNCFQGQNNQILEVSSSCVLKGEQVSMSNSGFEMS